MINNNVVSIVSCNSYDYQDISDALDSLFMSIGCNPSNPFSDIIKPGMHVFIKPNWVGSSWRASCPHKDNLYCVITHPSIIEAVTDRVAKALQGKGEIIIGDNPSIDADFNELMDFIDLKHLETKYDVPCEILDLRPLICTDLKYYGKLNRMVQQSGDPLGEVVVNLGKGSEFYGINPELFRGVFDEREETIFSHTGDQQLYSYARSIYDADVYISIPKLKTHQKVGVTLNLKGLVGAVTNKNQLVHWKVGSPETGGDEYPSLDALNAAKDAKVTHRGAWPGNDTIWRMVVDLYRGLLKKERTYISIVDGVMGGEGQGPFCPVAKDSKKLILGFDLLKTDIVATRLMGIEPRRIKYLNHFIESEGIDLEEISVISDGDEISGFFKSDDMYLDFDVMEQWSEIKVR